MSREERESLITEVLARILKDLTYGDITAIEILLKSVSNEDLRAYLGVPK